MKKRGFGKGLWNGIGGKIEKGESVVKAAKRELEEEIKVKGNKLSKRALLHFYFPDDPEKNEWNEDVHVFMVENWTGEPKETEEMSPEWFNISEVPYDKMWDADHLWMPRVLSGKKIEAWVAFDDNNKTAAQKIRKLSE